MNPIFKLMEIGQAEWVWLGLVVVTVITVIFALRALRSELRDAKMHRAQEQSFRGDRYADLPFFTGLLSEPLAWIALRCQPLLGATTVRQLNARLLHAGLEGAIDAHTFIAMRIIAALIALFVCLIFSFLRSEPFSFQFFGLMILASIAASFLPESWLSDVTKARKSKTFKSLPFYIDLLKISIEAGSNVQGALQYAVAYGPPGPLRNDFAKVLSDIRAGRSRADALHDLSARLDIIAVSHLCAAITAAEKQGASLTQLLQAQAEQRRQERFAAAETAAMKAPVKMLAPLVMFIFPGTFIILFFPVVMRLVQEGLLG
jgi:tight adherence protein C